MSHNVFDAIKKVIYNVTHLIVHFKKKCWTNNTPKLIQNHLSNEVSLDFHS